MLHAFTPAAVLAALILAATVNACYEKGARNQGAPGFPPVDYAPCCDGRPAEPKAGDWGLFCPGDAVGVVTSPNADCYAKGERAQGAPGRPAVQWKPCCDGGAQVDKDGDWGKFCAGEGVTVVTPPDADCYKMGERGQGTPGRPAVQWKPCCDGKAQVGKAGDWGKFCPGDDVVVVTPPDGDCYKSGERAQGAPGRPAVQWKPCCDGQGQVAKAGDRGKFCPGGTGGGDELPPGGALCDPEKSRSTTGCVGVAENEGKNPVYPNALCEIVYGYPDQSLFVAKYYCVKRDIGVGSQCAPVNGDGHVPNKRFEQCVEGAFCYYPGRGLEGESTCKKRLQFGEECEVRNNNDFVQSCVDGLACPSTHKSETNEWGLTRSLGICTPPIS